MSGFTEKIRILQQFLSKLTWEKIAQVTVLFLVLFLAWFTYETREDISRLMVRNDSSYLPLMELSKKTTEELDAAVNKFEIISAISIESIDFRTNTKTIVYISTNDKNLRDIFRKYEVERLEHPLFGNNSEINRRLIDLINGEFICNKYVPSVGGVGVSDTKGHIASVCSSSIPPYYGKIVGTINIYLKRDPINEEVDQIRFLAKSLATMVYAKEHR